ncbi:hypothetical protein [Streptococcus oricebi]|uniref:Tandem five-TM protein n=1 Tax=Streptococcus oricebi TaxID=1547447 RepID=A0ABS5B3V7_9STRE|nr:hypothetical protein [Streptococcus oricebi]MBP2623450.1 hypothetical protein [Streptococcus oricebi]
MSQFIAIGKFDNKMIYFDKKHSELYMLPMKQETAPDFRWLVPATSIAISSLMAKLNSSVIVEPIYRILIVLVIFLLSILLVEFALKVPDKEKIIKFDSKRYFEWDNFIAKEKSNFFLLLGIDLFISFIGGIYTFDYLKTGINSNLFIIILAFPLFYLFTFQIDLVNRFKILRKL